MISRRILVTGGNGFVGREVVRLLYDRHRVMIVDNLRNSPLRFRPDERAKCQFSQTDLTNIAAVRAVMSDFAPDTIIHLAAIHYIPECEQDPALAVRTNIDGTVNLLLNTPPGARFVFASSGAIYEPDDKPHKETDAAVGPKDVYGFTKLHGEHFVTYFAAQRMLTAVIVRLFNVVGPGETNPHLLPEVVAQLKAGRKVLGLGNMWPKRDYIHVNDAARGFISVALKDGIEPGRTITVNLGTSQTYSVAEIVEKLKLITGVEFAIEQQPSRLRNVDRPHLAADIGEINLRFDWRPQATLDQALADIWREPDLVPGLAERYQ